MLAVATTDPFDSDTMDFLEKKTGLKIVPFLATRKDIIDAISKHYLGGKQVSSEKVKILVVDDSLAITNLILAALQKEGYDVVVPMTASRG